MSGSTHCGNCRRAIVSAANAGKGFKMRAAILLLLGSAGLALGACDGWPTTVQNSSPTPISFAYWHDSYAQPSATVSLNGGQSIVLARELRLRDFREIRVNDNGHEFIVSGASLQQLKQDCPEYQCVIVYAGDGRLSARPPTSDDAEPRAQH